MATREAGGYSRRIEPTESNVTVCEWEGRGTSLSVTARKAAERVVAQLDGDGGKSLVAGGCRRRKPYQLNVSVCEHAEGSRACDRSMSLSVNMWKAAGHECGGFILFSFKGRELGTSLSVNERKAAERVVAQLEW
ncbi:hypothetical protein N7489_001146 [Penicillium chrysogenum]|uniref:uncharacterized protein n=1 Tax=Penicillium chrysogenum TaxID=5076 RepID=UPI0024DF2E29|nr:uncharacterized protein N7489_001146 [Penicillium chrysogenum]KAJ5250736.1 hypothetical protein N7489_001146 [Penicillium chrysogenum]